MRDPASLPRTPVPGEPAAGGPGQTPLGAPTSQSDISGEPQLLASPAAHAASRVTPARGVAVARSTPPHTTPVGGVSAMPPPAVAASRATPATGVATAIAFPAETQGQVAPTARTAHPAPPSHPTPLPHTPLAHTPLPHTPPLQAHTPLPAGLPAQIALHEPEPQPLPRSRREPAAVHVVGFWRRLIAAAIDLAVVIPAALIVTLVASWVTGLRLPGNLHLVDIDLWIDLVLASDPALVMGLVLFAAIGLTYLLVFQIIVGRTLGMRVMRIKIIDVYGDRPSAARCVARCGGYLAGVATLFLGFLWMGFDSEKRGLQDWIAGTLVIRA